MFSRNENDYQRKCSPRGPKNAGLRLLPSIIYDVLSFHWWSSASTWAYYNIYSWFLHTAYASSEDEEDMFPVPNNRSCILTLHKYHYNSESGFTDITDDIITCNNCSTKYQTSRIKNTNLLLVTVEEKSSNCGCQLDPLPYQPEEMDDNDCHVTVRYRRKPLCYDTNPHESSTFCRGHLVMTSSTLIIVSFMLSLLTRWVDQ